MKLNYNLQGAARKNLVEAASSILGWTPVYKKAPTFAYAVANYIIDKNGVLTGPDNVDLELALQERGFVAVDGREYDEPDTYESGLDGMDALPSFEDLNKTEGEELGLGQERRDPIGENGMQASDCPEPDALDIPDTEIAAPKRKGILDCLVDALNENAGEGEHWVRLHSAPQMELIIGFWLSRTRSRLFRGRSSS